jgi:hypothetical protein
VDRTVDSEVSEKRKLVASQHLSASFGMGCFQHPDETAEGLQINLIQKYSGRNGISVPSRKNGLF